METAEHVTQILDRISGAILEKSRFGRSENILFWLSAARLLKSAEVLKSEGGFDCLENFSAMQVEDDLVFTYFLRKSESGETAVFRVSVELKASQTSSSPDDAGVDLESVSSVWKMAIPFESEISTLFGVAFGGEKPKGAWNGFPLRKSFAITGGVSP